MMETFGNIHIYQGDCLELMRQFPDGYFDLAICDPPYFSGPERRSFFGSENSRTGVKRIYEKTETWQVPDESYFNELKRVAKHYIVFGCNYYQHIFPPGRIVWDKCNQSSYYSDCEIAATDLTNSVRMFSFMWNGMLQGKSMSEGRVMQGNKKKNEKRIHPTQKPVALYGWLLNTFAKPGWRILDTHLGSASSAIAADELGFEFHGIELSPHYYKAARKRIRDHSLQLRLF